MAVRWRFAAPTTLLMGALMTACGGGDVAVSVPLSYSVGEASISVQGSTDDAQPVQAVVPFTVLGFSHRPSGTTVNPQVTVAGAVVQGATATADDTASSVATSDEVQGSVTITFWPGSALGAGEYTGSVTLALCFDPTPATCTQMPAGGPTKIEFSYTIAGAARPSTTASITPGALQFQGARNDPSAPLPIELALTLAQPSPVVYVVPRLASGSVVSSVSFAATGSTGGTVTVNVAAASTMPVGLHTEDLALEVCLDPGCQRPLANSPVSVPLSYAVVPLAGLINWYRGGFAGKTIVVWGNSTVSNAVYFFQELRTYTAAGALLAGLGPQNILNYGNNGASLQAMLAGQGPYPIASVIAAQPDLLIMRGPLINDVRLGQTNLAQAEQRLVSALDQITQGSPKTSVLLTTENSLLTTNVDNLNFVQPNSAAQAYTDIMHDAVVAMKGRYPQVEVYDVMAIEYGLICPATSPLMLNQLHPGQLGQVQEADLEAPLIGLPFTLRE